MDKLKVEQSFDETIKLDAMSKTQEFSPCSEITCSKRIKPRAIIFKADDKDLHKTKALIETQFPKVEIIYVTSGSTSTFLRVTKSMHFEN